MDKNRIPEQVLQYQPKGRRNIGRPRKRWRTNFTLRIKEQETCLTLHEQHHHHHHHHHHHPKRGVSIAFPAASSVRNFFGFGEEVWQHSLLAFLVSGWWQWTRVSSPVTSLPRKPSPSASKHFRSSWQA